MINPKALSNLLLFSLFGLVHWFFGNLYEAIVIAPNLLIHTNQKIHNWQQFFTVTNPLVFYIPLVPLALIALFIGYRKIALAELQLRRYLKRAVIFGLLALSLGIYIITQINLKLFFADSYQSTEEVYRLALLWNVLNAGRIILLGLSVHNVFRGYCLSSLLTGQIF